jgi:hypothetical protein
VSELARAAGCSRRLRQRREAAVAVVGVRQADEEVVRCYSEKQLV